ncbi:MAG: PDZ domain-containing protein [Planctomycetota bacterium]|jgi:serine protease Do
MNRARFHFLPLFLAVLLSLTLFAPPVYADGDALKELSEEYKALYKKVLPAVVGITVQVNRSAGAAAPRTPRMPTRQRSRPGVQFDAYGSGAVISRDGFILTSMEVVPENTKTITVWFTNKRKAKARLIGYSKLNNIALIKVNVRNLKYLELGDSSKVRVGQRAMTFGSPFQATLIDGATVFSVGVVSGFYRARDQGKYKGMAFETDALACGGSDGGPLVDMQGRLIGVVDLAYNYSCWHGLVVPINQVKLILADLKKDMRVGPGFLGVKFKVSDAGDVVVKAVKDGSPSSAAGLKEDDVILSFCGEKIKKFSTLETMLEQLPPGTRFTAVVRRGKREFILGGLMARNDDNVIKREIPEVVKKPAEVEKPPVGRKAGFLGVKISEKIDKRGALVEDIMPGSPATKVYKEGAPLPDKTGIKKGDWIVGFDGKDVKNEKDLANILKNCFAGREYEVKIAREIDGEIWYRIFKVRLAETPKGYM